MYSFDCKYIGWFIMDNEETNINKTEVIVVGGGTSG